MFGLFDNYKTVPAGAVVTTERVVTRLSKPVFDHLVNQVNAHNRVTSQTTDLEAGFMLGMNYVLNAIAEGIVVESPISRT